MDLIHTNGFIFILSYRHCALATGRRAGNGDPRSAICTHLSWGWLNIFWCHKAQLKKAQVNKYHCCRKWETDTELCEGIVINRYQQQENSWIRLRVLKADRLLILRKCKKLYSEVISMEELAEPLTSATV